MQCLAEHRCFLKDVCQCFKYSARAWEKRAEKGREGWCLTYSKIENPEWMACGRAQDQGKISLWAAPQ